MIAYLGPGGTFSEEVVIHRLNYNKESAVSCSSLEEICEGIRLSRWDEGLLPVENSIEGAVGQTMDLLVKYPDLKIRGEVLHPVKLHLLVPGGVTRENIEFVLSHPQALGQCRDFIEKNLPGVQVMEAASTAHAAYEAAKGGRCLAAIASSTAAEVHNLHMLEDNINDSEDNITRFILLGKEEKEHNVGESKTTVILTLSDRPGALYSILGEFTCRGINLTRIESRPSKKKLGEYIFFIDLTGHKNHPRVAEVLEGIKEKCVTFRVAGSYPVAQSSEYNVPSYMSLEELRRNIDVLDREIIEILSRRITLTDQAVQYKEKGKVRDEKREQEIIHNMEKIAEDKGLSRSFAGELYKLILDYSVSRQSEKENNQ